MENSSQHYLTAMKLLKADITYFEQKVKAGNIQAEQLEFLNNAREKLKKLNEQIVKTT